MEKKDPAKDRDEFEKRLKYIFNETQDINIPDLIKSLLKGDEIKKKEYLDKIENLESKVTEYISKWDEAKTYEEKKKVVGSVKKEKGNV